MISHASRLSEKIKTKTWNVNVNDFESKNIKRVNDFGKIISIDARRNDKSRGGKGVVVVMILL